MREARHWLITGVSSGFGRSIAEAALARGDSITGTLRKKEDAAAFEALAPGQTDACLLDLTDRNNVSRVIAEAVERHGGVDVLVNNAGYALAGAVEEFEEAEIRDQMETNFFGLAAATRAVLPVMRRQKSGHIINIASVAGLWGFPGMAMYSASKFAVVGFSEALAGEMAPFGVKVTALEPGAFRTKFSSSSSFTRARRPIEAYEPTVGKLCTQIASYDGNQPGDPGRAAQAVLQLVDLEEPPVHLLLGKDAVQLHRQKLTMTSQSIDQWEALSSGTDYV